MSEGGAKKNREKENIKIKKWGGRFSDNYLQSLSFISKIQFMLLLEKIVSELIITFSKNSIK